TNWRVCHRGGGRTPDGSCLTPDAWRLTRGARGRFGRRESRRHTRKVKNLSARIPADVGPDALYDVFTEWVTEQGLALYPHQDEAFLEILSGSNLILATPTGSGKSLVATAAHFTALAEDR